MQLPSGCVSGGLTRMLQWEKLEFFKCEPHIDIDPTRSPAIGAAIQANVLAVINPMMRYYY
ncbi:MAG: hypothetical protein R3E08_04760 [Thiotrichaceae bacterium]